MAEPITMQKLTDASIDSDTLGEFANEDKLVTSRLGLEYPSAPMASRLLVENGLLGATPFSTHTAMTASALVDGDYAVVTNDSELLKNGIYEKSETGFIKSDINRYIRLEDTIKPDDSDGFVFTDELGFIVSTLGIDDAYLAGISIAQDDDGKPDMIIRDPLGFIGGRVPRDETIRTPSSNSDESDEPDAEPIVMADIRQPLISKNIIGWDDDAFRLYLKNTTDNRSAIKTVLYSSGNASSASGYEVLEIDASKFSASSYFTQRIGDIFAETPVNVRAVGAGGGTAIKVMMLGDSITNGGAAKYVYDKLSLKGFAPTMVGTNKYGGDARYMHEGHNGYTTAYYTNKDKIDGYVIPVQIGDEGAYLNGTIEGNVNRYNPFIKPSNSANSRNGYEFDASFYRDRFNIADVDVVVINMGTNDLRDYPENTLDEYYYTEMKIIIESLRAAYPNVTILLGAISTIDTKVRTDLWGSSVAINRFAQQLASELSYVYFVPMNAMSNPDAGYSINGTASGHTQTKMGTIKDPVHPASATRIEFWEQVTAYIAAAKINLLEK